MYQPVPLNFRVLSIDPGSRKGLGICISEYGMDAMSVLHAATIVVDDIIKDYEVEVDRFDVITDVIMELIRQWWITEVVVEDIFFKPGRLLAYRALLLTHNAIRIAIRDTLGGSFTLIRANEAKVSVGVPNNSGDKELMKKALLTPREDLKFSVELDLMWQEEHAIDAIAIGYGHYRRRRDGFTTD